MVSVVIFNKFSFSIFSSFNVSTLLKKLVIYNDQNLFILLIYEIIDLYSSGLLFFILEL